MSKLSTAIVDIFGDAATELRISPGEDIVIYETGHIDKLTGKRLYVESYISPEIERNLSGHKVTEIAISLSDRIIDAMTNAQ